MFGNKKGFFFTFVAIIIISIFFLNFIVIPESQKPQDIDTNTIKVTLHDDYVRSLTKEYLPDLMQAKTKEMIVDQFVKGNGKIANFRSRAPSEIEAELTAYLDAIETIANEDLNMQTDLSLTIDSIHHETPFIINISGTLQLKVTSLTQDINFTYDAIPISTGLSVVGMKDPLFVEAVGYSNARTIVPTQIVEWNGSSTQQFLESTQYRHTSMSPSFIDRLEGNYYSSDGFGMESLIVRSDFGGADAVADVDYMFLTGQPGCPGEDAVEPIDLFFIQNSDGGTFDDFWLDSAHIGVYNLKKGLPWTGC